MPYIRNPMPHNSMYDCRLSAHLRSTIQAKTNEMTDDPAGRYALNNSCIGDSYDVAITYSAIPTRETAATTRTTRMTGTTRLCGCWGPITPLSTQPRYEPKPPT